METKLNRSSNVVWEELDEAVVVVSLASGARWLLSAAAAAVWKLCDGSRSTAELAAKLALSRAEIAECCSAFQQQGLLRAPGAEPMLIANGCFRSGPGARMLNLGASGRKRPSPRGISGPA